MAEPVPPGDGYTVKEIVSSIQSDVRTLSGKLDGYVAAHQAQHGVDATMLANMHGDANATPAGRRIRDDIDALGRSLREESATRREAQEAAGVTHDGLARIVDRHDVLIQRMIGAGSILMVLIGLYEALRTARILV